MQSELSFKNIQSVIVKRRIPLIIIALISGVLAVIFSGESFLKPRYKSSAAVFPINVEPFSDESETEQMMQLFDNNLIRKNIIEKFDLGNRYGYKPEDKNYMHLVNKLYDERVSISPTRYESVEIICQDEDPKVAKEMVEEVILQYNQNVLKIEQDFHREYYEMLSDEVDVQQGWIDSLNNKMYQIKARTGIVDYDLQVERITEGYMKLLEKNVQGSRMQEVELLMAGMRKDGANLRSMNLLVEYIAENMQETYEAKSMEYSKLVRKVSYANVVKSPEETDKKHWPVRWLILALALFSSLFAAIVFFMLIEK